MDELTLHTRAYISRHQMLMPGDTVIVALSGGADSTALLHVLLSLRESLGIVLGAAHVHHGLRGAEADRDAAFVREMCAQHGVFLRETRLSPPPHAGEEWARTERYRFFETLTREERVKIATAHTASDNAETILFHLARGSAARGAAGIPPVRGVYIRPLLWAQRADILSFLTHRHLSYVTDSTNEADTYARNRLRHRVLPLLEDVHPGAARNLARFAAEMTDVADYLDAQAAALLREAQEPSRAFLPAFALYYRVQTLLSAPAPVRRTALAQLIGRCAPQQKTSLVPRAEALLTEGHGRLQLGSAAYLLVSQGRLSLETDGTAEESAWSFPFTFGSFALDGGLTLTVERRNCEEMIKSAKDAQNLLKFSADYDKIHDNAYFRTIRPHDRFRPAGRGVTKPLRKWYSEQKIPLSVRTILPVLAAQNDVLWAAGFGFAEGLAVHSYTQTAVTIHVRRTEDIV